jgi:hypothetical protein
LTLRNEVPARLAFSNDCMLNPSQRAEAESHESSLFVD